MPVLSESHNPIHGTHYGFSACHLDHLGSTEYTLVTICADVSASVYGFISQIEQCLDRIVASCAHAPRADNLLLRVITFNQSITELHGFKPLLECSGQSYQGQLQASGATALYDASYNAISTIINYGQHLVQHDFDVNGIVFVITDGEDNQSKARPKGIKKLLRDCMTEEDLESMLSVLVGVNVKESSLSKRLDQFKSQAHFDEYIELDNAESKTLQKLAHFVSQSISLQSRALGSGQSAVALSL